MIASLSFLALAPLAAPGGGDYYLSPPAAGAIWKVDHDTGIGSAFAVGTLIPHYGIFATDGTLYMPDRGWPALLKISPTGTITALAAGGYFDKPVTCIHSLDGKALIVSDGGADKILRVELDTGAQSVLFDQTTSNGLLASPDGLAYDEDGNLYVANLTGHNIVKIDPQGNASIFSNSPLISQPGGIAIDGSGNLFVANYGSSTIARFRLDTGEGEIFANDVTKMAHPNDIKLSRHGGIITTTRQSNVCRIDSLGNITVEFNDPNLGEIVGVSAPEDAVPCSGKFFAEETSSVGSGGFSPKLRAIYSPCPGLIHGLEFVDFPGGAPAVMFIGLGAAKLKASGADFYLNPALPLFPIPLVMPGVGAGEGDLRLQFTVPDDTNLSGLHVYFQVLAADPGGVNGLVWTHRLHEIIGS